MKKYKDQLKRLGMEDEFKIWTKDIENIKYKFDDMRAGTKFCVVKGDYKGTEASIIDRLGDNCFSTNLMPRYGNSNYGIELNRHVFNDYIQILEI